MSLTSCMWPREINAIYPIKPSWNKKEGQSQLNSFSEKFNLPPEIHVDLKDSSGIEDDADIFDELMTSSEVSFKVFTGEQSDLSEASFCSVGSDSSSGSTVILEEIKARRRNRTDSPVDSNAAGDMISAILDSKAGGEKIFLEFAKTNSLSDSTRRLLVNMLVADMIEKHGRVPPSSVRTKHALGIVTLLPYLKDPDSSNGYEHYCDAESGSGYLAWRIKTVQRNTSHGTKKRSMSTYQDGPKAKRASHSTVEQLTGDECREAIYVLQHSTDESLVKEKMRATFKHRQNIVQDPEKSSTILGVFPRFLDIPGLIDQDFTMLFGEDASGKFLAKWPTLFRPRVITDCKNLPPSAHLEALLSSVQHDSDDLD
ncbi:uncharacterized protein LOC131725055 isoform X2 [Acipenser ruthenus]|uniref:uncharacterized protein LOC131725055 isoform X2 n=1 Tax=Acipenser ruthenus TaxID=7906 RepID=UPI0027426407|nr:uncharacterized protein LOC131725055 isoform X2 [Acipenser ruthenus]